MYSIDWRNSTDASPALVLKEVVNITNNTGNNYLELVSNGIAHDFDSINIFGVQMDSSSNRNFYIVSTFLTSLYNKEKSPLNDLDFGIANCSFDKISYGGHMICDKSFTIDELRKSNYATVPGSNDTEIIYLNFVYYNKNSTKSRIRR